MDYRIKDMPQDERPREKLDKNGVSSLSKSELLSLILRAGTSGKNVKQLSAEILDVYPLESLAERHPDDLKKFRGVSDVKAGQLLAVGELARRMQNEDRQKIESLTDAAKMVQDMKFRETELVRVFLLNSGNEILEEREFEGDVSGASFSSQKIFREALARNAAALVLAHNHPSGRSEPTEQDIRTTESLIEIGRELGVKLLDHIIIGDSVESMRTTTELRF
ncbi:MAG: RadC family protein [Candidatus Nanohaloarchaea archaeon]